MVCALSYIEGVDYKQAVTSTKDSTSLLFNKYHILYNYIIYNIYRISFKKIWDFSTYIHSLMRMTIGYKIKRSMDLVLNRTLLVCLGDCCRDTPAVYP